MVPEGKAEAIDFAAKLNTKIADADVWVGVVPVVVSAAGLSLRIIAELVIAALLASGAVASTARHSPP